TGPGPGRQPAGGPRGVASPRAVRRRRAGHASEMTPGPTESRSDQDQTARTKSMKFVLTCAGVMLVASVGTAGAGADSPPETPAAFLLPTVPAEHRHVRALLANALRYVAPEHLMIDPVSGYPYEGWNHDPKRGLFLRSFTQLTAIGQWMELLANVVAGKADTPSLSREQALAQLTKLVASLRADQRDPRLGAKGLLVNFLDLATGKRLGPLAGDVDKSTILDAFGPERGEAIWKALVAKGWIVPRRSGLEAAIQRGATFG